MKKVLIDTNIALDLLQAHEGYLEDALYIFSLGEQGYLQLCLSTDSLSTIFYVIEKNTDAQTAREAVSKLLDFVTLCSLDESAVLRGMTLDFVDVEDAFICAVSMKTHCNAIITRNAKDFANSPLPVFISREFVAMWRAQHA